MPAPQSSGRRRRHARRRCPHYPRATSARKRACRNFLDRAGLVLNLILNRVLNVADRLCRLLDRIREDGEVLVRPGRASWGLRANFQTPAPSPEPGRRRCRRCRLGRRSRRRGGGRGLPRLSLTRAEDCRYSRTARGQGSFSACGTSGTACARRITSKLCRNCRTSALSLWNSS